MAGLTPMMRQYLDIKNEYPDCILFFRLGDFYEMFFEDAETASQVLEIVLTGRDAGLDKRVPMCGIPFHSAEGYISKLITSGHKVAICEQTEDARFAKGLVKREVIRVVTPGTVLESNMLTEKENNFLIAINKIDSYYGLAYADITTGEIAACVIYSIDTLQNEIARLSPKEVIIHPLAYHEDIQKFFILGNVFCNINEEYFNATNASQIICDFFATDSIEALGLYAQEASTHAVSALLSFINKTQKIKAGVFSEIKLYSAEKYMILDTATRRNLELIQPLRSTNKHHSLLAIIDYTITAMGGRLLRNWLQQPLIQKSTILDRQNTVNELAENYFLRAEIRELLKGVYDLERIAGRVTYGNVTPKDLLALRNSLFNITVLQSALIEVKSTLLKDLKNGDALNDIKELLNKAISDTPPQSAKEEGIIKTGYNPEIDSFRLAKRDGKNWIAALEAKEREATGIKSLKVGYNKIFGYYIEVTHTHATNVPDTYIRKQTLANAERYITPELKEIEDKILGAEEKLLELEYKIFSSIRNEVAKNITRLQTVGKMVAVTDSLQALAECAVVNNYTRPEFIDEDKIHIIGGRHPVVEKNLNENFVPNDCFLNYDSPFMLLTGPNMAGKSTYMRQLALIVLLAQIGSFVPADETKLGVVDRIFTRVGAADDLAMGQSTFMVEMIETANILRHATKNSLVILDEIGRGTSTYDGLSIAWAVAEYLISNNLSKTIFATHYHELTELTKYHTNVVNFHVAVKEKGEDIIFVRKILPGATDRSYGIHVAKLAGLPLEVLNRSAQLLTTLENIADRKIPESSLQTISEKPKQVTLFETEQPMHPILTEISTLNIVNISPLEALLKINSWQNKLKDR